MAGQPINRAFRKYNKNSGDIIMLAAVISGDSESKMIAAYKQYGDAPEFPLILASGGGKKLAKLFDYPNLGSYTWLMHPKRFYKMAFHTEPAIYDGIDAALKDDCNESTVIGSTHVHKKQATIQSLDKSSLSLRNFANGLYKIVIFDIHGRIAFSKNVNLSGSSIVNLGNSKVGHGFYLIKIIAENGLIILGSKVIR